MDIMQAMRTAIQEWVVPEFDKLRLENAEIRTALQLTNKRLDDMYAQLVDQSRRIDETNKRIDEVRKELIARIDGTNMRIDETNKRIDRLHEDLLARIERVQMDMVHRFDETNQRLDRLYEVIVRRDEHEGVVAEVRDLKQRVEALERRLAA